MPTPNGVRALCAVLKEATASSRQLASMKASKTNLSVALALQRAGFLTSVTVGSKDRPTPEITASQSMPLPLIKNRGIVSVGLQMHKDQAERQGKALGATQNEEKNLDGKRLWIELAWNKFEDRPLMQTVTCMMLPKKPVITATFRQMRGLLDGQYRNQLRPIQDGEGIITNTDLGVMTINEAVAKKRGGALLVRVSPMKRSSADDLPEYKPWARNLRRKWQLQDQGLWRKPLSTPYDRKKIKGGHVKI